MNRKSLTAAWAGLAMAIAAVSTGCESGQATTYRPNSSSITNYSLKPSPVTGYIHQGAADGTRAVAGAPTE